MSLVQCLPTLEPRLSVIMAARNVADFIDAAIASVLDQTLTDLELIVVDDGSDDQTPEKLRAWVKRDPRVSVLPGRGTGPAAARNLALSQARGRWVAVVDADDTITPDRFERLLNEAQSRRADIIADNLTAFYADGRPEHPWLTGPAWTQARDVSLEVYLTSGADGGATNQLGYLKPVFLRQGLVVTSLFYDETLTIGEDYDFVARALLQGARLWYVPAAGYRYRRHGDSISYRIRSDQVAAMQQALLRLRALLPSRHAGLLDQRLATLSADLKFARLVESLKVGQLSGLTNAVMDAQIRIRLTTAVIEGLQRRLGLARSAPRTA